MSQKFLITLTVLSLSFTAFLSGYLISQKDFHRTPSSNSSGNILDKFSDKDAPSPEARLMEQAVRLLNPRSIVSPVMSKEKDSIIYYEKDTGKVFEVALKDATEKSISNISLTNLIKTVWAPSRKEVVSVFYYPAGDHYAYFNYTTKASADLGDTIRSLVFSPDGNQVAYFGSKGDSRGIFLSKPDGSSFKKLLSSRLETTEVYWPANELLSFRTDSIEGSELYSLSKTGDIKKILDSRDGLEVKWSPDGSRVLFSQKVDSGIDLFYKDISSELEIPLNVATSASKCEWGIDGKTIVCGVPRSSASGDEIYEIGIDGTKKLLSSPISRINTAELFLSGLNDYVVILNSLDSKLYVLKK